ncbi:MAG: DNA recombination protein RmuC, partial [Alphaproteobacteria bacterium]
AAALERDLAASRAEAARLAALEPRLAQLSERLAEARAEQARGMAALQAERAQHAARVEELRRLEDRLAHGFDRLAASALDQTARRLLDLAAERFEGQKAEALGAMASREAAIAALVRPLAEALDRLETHIGALETARTGAQAELAAQLGQLAEGQMRLQSETRRLVQALRAPKTRGRWGEMQLQRVLEMAGMTRHVDFVTETALPGSAGRLRPDAIVHLPGGRSILLDAKTPLEAYLEGLEAPDEAARRRAFAAHARQLRAHVRQLSAKAYWQALDTTPDFVVLFLPAEAFYAAAAEADPELIQAAIESRVLIATPMTLVALLKSIAHGWQQDRMAREALAVADAARQLHERLRGHLSHLSETGGALRRAVGAFNAAVASLEARLLPAARRLETLGVVAPDRAIGPIAPIDTEPRGVADPATGG